MVPCYALLRELSSAQRAFAPPSLRLQTGRLSASPGEANDDVDQAQIENAKGLTPAIYMHPRKVLHRLSETLLRMIRWSAPCNLLCINWHCKPSPSGTEVS